MLLKGTHCSLCSKYNFVIYFYLCVIGMRNPIKVACKLLDEELKGPSDSGLVPPMYASHLYLINHSDRSNPYPDTSFPIDSHETI